jgi:hypothetical protein
MTGAKIDMQAGTAANPHSPHPDHLLTIEAFVANLPSWRDDSCFGLKHRCYTNDNCDPMFSF